MVARCWRTPLISFPIYVRSFSFIRSFGQWLYLYIASDHTPQHIDFVCDLCVCCVSFATKIIIKALNGITCVISRCKLSNSETTERVIFRISIQKFCSGNLFVSISHWFPLISIDFLCEFSCAEWIEKIWISKWIQWQLQWHRLQLCWWWIQ